MTEYCINHPMTEALSICHNCGKHFCAECLSEGKEYYYCKAPECQLALNKELNPDSIPGEVICPECKAVVRLNSEEMSKHLFRCPECESLINILVNGPEIINDPDFVELFSTRSQPDISLIHSILDDSGLDFYITGENLLSLWTGIAKVFVASGQVNQAKELLKDFEIHLFGLSNKETEDAE
jgi:hypothetical protein